MNREVSIRQIAYMYLFISLSPVLRQIPNALALEAGRAGYLSNIWSIFAIAPLTGILIVLIKSFPGLNFYEIMVQLVGKVIAKILLFGYIIWLMLLLTTKVNVYALTLQFTLMPKTRTSYFLVILIILVFFALKKGMKTIFRFTEFTLGPIFVIFLLLLISAIPSFRTEYLLPVSTQNLPTTIYATKNVLAIGGHIVFAIFFADKFGLTLTKRNLRNLWYGIVIFMILSFGVTVITYGITGAGLTAKLPFPFYITAKSITFLNVFERFEVLITMVSVLSDYIAISLYTIILLRCVQWLFNLNDYDFLLAPTAVVIYFFTFYLSATQFEFIFFYRNILLYINLIFQYLVPLFIGFFWLIKRKRIRKMY